MLESSLISNTSNVNLGTSNLGAGALGSDFSRSNITQRVSNMNSPYTPGGGGGLEGISATLNRLEKQTISPGKHANRSYG
jgi:hypothetical protein